MHQLVVAVWRVLPVECNLSVLLEVHKPRIHHHARIAGVDHSSVAISAENILERLDLIVARLTHRREHAPVDSLSAWWRRQ